MLVYNLEEKCFSISIFCSADQLLLVSPNTDLFYLIGNQKIHILIIGQNAEYRPQQPATLIIGLILTNINVHFLFVCCFFFRSDSPEAHSYLWPVTIQFHNHYIQKYVCCNVPGDRNVTKKCHNDLLQAVALHLLIVLSVTHAC